jgi:hypothetical protein
VSERAWPFEGIAEGGVDRRAGTPAAFVADRGTGTVAVVVRIGLHDAQLVLVDADGDWDRWVYHSTDAAEHMARSLGIPVHVGEYPEELRVLMNSRIRPRADFDRRAYPEQGEVGPVIPYPENRPRRIRDGETPADGDHRGNE